jgi:hypothetical protein
MADEYGGRPKQSGPAFHAIFGINRKPAFNRYSSASRWFEAKVAFTGVFGNGRSRVACAAGSWSSHFIYHRDNNGDIASTPAR